MCPSERLTEAQFYLVLVLRVAHIPLYFRIFFFLEKVVNVEIGNSQRKKRQMAKKTYKKMFGGIEAN